MTVEFTKQELIVLEKALGSCQVRVSEATVLVTLLDKIKEYQEQTPGQDIISSGEPDKNM